MSNAALLIAFGAAQERLDAALSALDADGILAAAVGLHEATAALAAPGAWHDETDVRTMVQQALRRIESCRLRVMFMADMGRDHVDRLTRNAPIPRAWRPDRHG